MQLEFLKLEFHQFIVEKETQSISLEDFGQSIINYVDPKNTKKFQSALKNNNTVTEYQNERITFQQFYGMRYH
jgi:hypothetical protein